MKEYDFYYLHRVDGQIQAIDGAGETFEAADDGAAEQEALRRLAAFRKAHSDWDIYGLDLDANPETDARRVATLT